MKLIDSIVAEAASIAQIRKDIHAHPELCFEEVRTADLVAAKLTEWGIPIHRGLGTTGVVGIVVNDIGDIAGSAALISLGMALMKYGISDGVKPALVTSLFKLFLLPASVYTASRLLGLDATWTAALVLTSSVPTGINAWLIANRFGVGHGLASSSITITTAVGVVTTTFWAWLLG